jgi:hypothetical protein
MSSPRRLVGRKKSANALHASQNHGVVSSGPMLSDQELHTLATRMFKGMEVKDRRYHMRMYTKVFVGTDAVSWLMNPSGGGVKDEMVAVSVGSMMVKRGKCTLVVCHFK